MGRSLNRLSAVQVKAITGKGMHSDGGGLYLQVSAGGAKSWIFRFTFAGATRQMGLSERVGTFLRSARKENRRNLRVRVMMAAPNCAPTPRPARRRRLEGSPLGGVALFVAIDLFALLVAFLRFHRQRCDGPGLEPL